MLSKNLFRKPKNKPETAGIQAAGQEKPSVPDQLCIACPQCRAMVFTRDLRETQNVCPKCGHHFRVSARRRIAMVVDKGSFTELYGELRAENIIGFPEYEKKLKQAVMKSGEKESVICGTGAIEGQPCAVFAMEAYFMMGSMGAAAGEKITALFEYAAQNSLPVVGFAVSGGARMQEGILSLMQMAKTSGAVKRHSDSGNLYISVLTDPTTGGVSASFAMEGDIILAEPNALIGFAGPRVVEQTIGQKLPAGFQRAEFVQQKGFVDAVVPRAQQRGMLASLLKLHSQKAVWASHGAQQPFLPRQSSLGRLTPGEDAFQRVCAARAKGRATGADYIENIFENFWEFHGDRRFGDDKAVVGGIALLKGLPVTVIAIEKGHTTKEKVERNFGSAHPEGYRKALRLMKQAEKFCRPVVCFVDTAGAYCGIGAEERGQAQAIAENLMEMMTLKTPVISVLVGEGGSGGALALAVADQVWMLENAVYSVISPEGCSSILWKNPAKVKEAAQCLKMTAEDLLALGVVEQVIPEPAVFSQVYHTIREMLSAALAQQAALPVEELLENRYARYRRMGKTPSPFTGRKI